MMVKLITIMMFISLTAVAHAGDRFVESDLATLFSSQKVRDKIDQKRKGVASDSETVQHASPSSIKVNGIVKRSDGKSTVWVNGRNNLKHSTVDGVKVLARQKRTDSVAVYVDGELVRIKPGETWSEDSSGQ